MAWNGTCANLTCTTTANYSEYIDIQQLLTNTFGDRRRDLPSAIALTIVYSLVLISGTLGNICTCVVIAKNNYMQTTTNYYLFSLAVSDLLMIFSCLPSEVYQIWEAYPWIFGEPFCIFKNFLTEMTSYASVLTITTFTIERYVAICHPLISHTMAHTRRAVKIIIGIWSVAFCFALPYPINTRTFYYKNHPVTGKPINDSLTCGIPHEWQEDMTIMFQISSFLFFVTPMAIITVMYILIGITIRRSGLSRGASEESCHGGPRGSGNSAPRRAVLKMLVAVVVAFFVCWAPFHAQRFMTLYVRYDDWTPTLLEVQSQLFYVSGLLLFVSSTVNPILYNLMSKRYRQAFRETLCCCCLDQKHTLRNQSGRGFSEFSVNNSLRNARLNSLDRETTRTACVPKHKVSVDKDDCLREKLLIGGLKHIPVCSKTVSVVKSATFDANTSDTNGKALLRKGENLCKSEQSSGEVCLSSLDSDHSRQRLLVEDSRKDATFL